MPPVIPPLIYAKMAAVMAAVEAISKDRNNPQQGYKFRGIDDCLNALHGPLSEHGVCFGADVRDVVKSTYATAKGTAMLHVLLTVRYTFYAADGSSMSYEAVGEASDSGDKAAGKAQAYALKVALLQVFCIPTEEQKDTEYASPDRAVAPAFRPTYTGDELLAGTQAFLAARSKAELREVYDSLAADLQLVLKPVSVEAAARIDAAILKAAAGPLAV